MKYIQAMMHGDEHGHRYGHGDTAILKKWGHTHGRGLATYIYIYLIIYSFTYILIIYFKTFSGQIEYFLNFQG